MAKSRRKNGGPTHGRFKPTKLGKGWLANRKVRGETRPVLRITEPEAKTDKKG
jgi:hypothetical protein